MKSFIPSLAASLLLLSATPASATEDRLELWLNPAVTTDLDDKTSIELETAQRFRESPADDTYYARLWLGRGLGKGLTLSAGVERRHEGEGRETRLLQQLSYPLVGILKGRTRLEQRFLNDEPRTAFRLRQRLGVGIPLSSDGWEVAANAEGFFTLRASEAGGQTGLTGLRTFVGVEREFDRVEVSLGYLRQQTIREARPDTVGHAPFVGLTFKL
jgi:hypothetical protein